MKKIIKLTESDLARIVINVINENNNEKKRSHILLYNCLMTKTNWYNKSNIRSVNNKNWSIIEGSLESGDKVVYAREFVNEKLKNREINYGSQRLRCERKNSKINCQLLTFMDGDKQSIWLLNKTYVGDKKFIWYSEGVTTTCDELQKIVNDEANKAHIND